MKFKLSKANVAWLVLACLAIDAVIAGSAAKACEPQPEPNYPPNPVWIELIQYPAIRKAAIDYIYWWMNW